MDEARFADKTIGRYAMCAEIAAGGMATVHLGKLLGQVGFSRIVAIKALHPQFARDPDFLSMFLDEARLAGRVRHPNVVSVFDVVAREGELYLIMDYVPGETLARLARALRAEQQSVPFPIAAAIMAGALEGLHAAHEARDEFGKPLGIVHRDISPQNILVGTDGVAKILDFGVAKAVGRMQMTRNDQLKGKIAYMAPEQLLREPIDRGADIYAASIVLWELLTMQRLYQGDSEIETFQLALAGVAQAPSQVRRELPQVFDAIVSKGLSRRASERYATAREMARALEDTGLMASTREVSDWVERAAHETLAERALRLAEVEQSLPHAELQRELDPLQAQHDASLLRKIDARATAELDTDIVSVTQSAASAPELPRPEGSPRRSRVAIASFALFTVVSLLLFRRERDAPLSAASHASAVLSASAAPAVVPRVIVASAAPEPSQAAPVASGVAVDLVSRPRHALKSQHRPEPSAPQPNAECKDPFTLDEHGVRIPKRQCL